MESMEKRTRVTFAKYAAKHLLEKGLWLSMIKLFIRRYEIMHVNTVTPPLLRKPLYKVT